MSCGLHDSVRLEERGVPVVMLVTDAFVRSVNEQLEVISASAFEPVYIPHPVASLPPEEVWKKADAALPDIVARLTGSDGSGSPSRSAPGTKSVVPPGSAGVSPALADEAGETPALPGDGAAGVVCPVDAGPDCEECAVDAAERGL